MGGQNLFDFSEKSEDRYFFFFSVLHYPKEYVVYCQKKNCPIKGHYVKIEDSENARNYLVRHGIEIITAEKMIVFAEKNEGKCTVFLTYEDLPVF